MSQGKVISLGGLPIRNLTLDIPTISKFCLSVGMARAMAQTSNLEWQRTELSGLLKLLYMAMPWKEPPGNAVFTVAERDKLYELARDMRPTGRLKRSNGSPRIPNAGSNT
jgi:hypothetical protein